MKQHVQGTGEADLKRRYPIVGRTRGWFFRANETSNGVWLVEGIDAYGRQVSRQGVEVDQLIAECENDATKINEGIA